MISLDVEKGRKGMCAPKIQNMFCGLCPFVIEPVKISMKKKPSDILLCHSRQDKSQVSLLTVYQSFLVFQ